MLATVQKVYNDLWDIRDRRLDGYFLADSLTVNIALVCLYVFLVKVVGPWHMKNRDPYNPKLLMQAYNLFQVVFCSYFVIEGGRKAWFNHYSWGKSGRAETGILASLLSQVLWLLQIIFQKSFFMEVIFNVVVPPPSLPLGVNKPLGPYL